MSDGTLTLEQQVAISKRLQRIARMIDRELSAATGERVAWSLYTWGGNLGQYVSNTDREQAKIAMLECLDRWNEPKDPPPHQGFN